MFIFEDCKIHYFKILRAERMFSNFLGNILKLNGSGGNDGKDEGNADKNDKNKDAPKLKEDQSNDGGTDTEGPVEGDTAGTDVEEPMEVQENEDPVVSKELGESVSFVAHYVRINTQEQENPGEAQPKTEASKSSTHEETMNLDSISIETVGTPEDPSKIGESEQEVSGPPDKAPADPEQLPPKSSAHTEALPWANIPDFNPNQAVFDDIPFVDEGFHFQVPEPAAVIIHEQDVALQLAIQAQKDKEESIRLAKEREMAKKVARQIMIEEALSQLQEEPTHSLTGGTVTIRFHTPKGNITRRFSVQQSLHAVYVFLTAQGFLPNEISVSFAPGQMLQDSEDSFVANNLVGNFVLHVTNKPAQMNQTKK